MIDVGIVNDDIDVAPSNEYAPIEVTLVPTVILVKPDPENAYVFIVVTLLGIVIPLNDVVPSNEYAPIDVMSAPMVTLVN